MSSTAKLLMRLKGCGEIVSHDSDIVPTQGQRHRWFYGTAHFWSWADNGLPLYERRPLGGKETYGEQLLSILTRFIDGSALQYPRQFHALDHGSSAIWELKTDALRIFGWFPERNRFVAHIGDLADRVKDERLYRSHIDEATKERIRLGFVERRLITSEDPNDVVYPLYIIQRP